MQGLDNERLSAFYKASEDLKANFTEKKLKALIELYAEIPQEELIRDHSNAKHALADLPLEFYDEIADTIHEDINRFPEFWFMYDTRIGTLFNEETMSYIINRLFEKFSGTSTEYIYKGILALNDESYDLAMLYFNQSDHYLINYYKGLCYLARDNFANAIKNFKIFLTGVDEYIANSEIPKEYFDPAQNFSLTHYQWESYGNLMYMYNETRDFDLAVASFNQACSLRNLEEVYTFMDPVDGSNGLSEFEVYANNYLFALEKLGKDRERAEFLERLLEILPENNFYRKSLIEVKERIDRHETADNMLKNIFRVRRPFDIEAFNKAQSLAREKVLEDMILEQIKYGIMVFGKKLELYQDENVDGRQYFVKGANGFLDLLLVDKENDTLFVVELKRGLAGIEVVEQIENYMAALSEELNKPLKGIICLHQANPKLTNLVRSKKDIELFTYHFDFKKLG
jgi:hypothetical protein